MKELRDSFAKADRDGDGALNPEEWMEVMRDAGIEIKRYEELETLSSTFLQEDKEAGLGKLTQLKPAIGKFTLGV